MGRMAVTLLAHRLGSGKGAGVTQTLVRPQLIERESVITVDVASSESLADLLGSQTA